MVDEHIYGSYTDTQYSPSLIKFSLADSIIVLFVACIGLFGSFYVFGSLGQEPVETDNKSLSSHLSNIEFQTTPVSSPVKANTDYAHINISGKQEAGQFLYFEIPAYNTQGRYFIDFGDGIIKELDSNEFVYSYAEAGKYKLRLIVDYKDQKAIIQEQMLELLPATGTSRLISSL